jgi:hypothetical protein
VLVSRWSLRASGGCSPAECLAWAAVECERDGGELISAVTAEIGALGKY